MDVSYVMSGKQLANGLLLVAAKELGLDARTISTKAVITKMGVMLDEWRDLKLKEHAAELLYEQQWERIMDGMRLDAMRRDQEAKRQARRWPARLLRWAQRASGLSEDAVMFSVILLAVPCLLVAVVMCLRLVLRG